MVIKHKPHSKEFIEQCEQEHRIRRVTSLKDSEPGSDKYFQGQIELSHQRPGVFEQISGLRRRLPCRMPMDINPFKSFIACTGSPLSFRTDNRDPVPGVSQGTSFPPHSTILRNRQVLHYDENRYCCAPRDGRCTLSTPGRIVLTLSSWLDAGSWVLTRIRWRGLHT